MTPPSRRTPEPVSLCSSLTPGSRPPKPDRLRPSHCNESGRLKVVTRQSGSRFGDNRGGVLPLKDENPTTSTPVATVAVLLACLIVFFGWQPLGLTDETVDVTTNAGVLRFDPGTAFTISNATIPCEVVNQRPLTVDEVVATFSGSIDGEECEGSSAGGPAVFPDKNVWLSVLVSMFLHGGLVHLGGNLLFLWIFGNNIEDHMGSVRFVLFYLLGGVVATGAHIALNADSTIPMVGASGAIAAVMGAYLVWFPDAPVRTAVFMFFIFVTDIRAKWLLGFWFVSQFFTNPNSGVAWAAHVGGFVFGVVAGLAIRANPGLRSLALKRRPAPGSRWDNTGGAGYNPYRTRRLGRG